MLIRGSSIIHAQTIALFVTILIFGEPSEPNALWEKYKEVMGEDLLRQLPNYLQRSTQESRKHVDNEVLILLQDELEGMRTCLEKFSLPTPDMQNRIHKVPKVIQEEMFNFPVQKEISEMKCQLLNTDQHQAFALIMEAIQDKNHPQCFLSMLQEAMAKH